VQKQLIEQIPVVHNAFTSPDLVDAGEYGDDVLALEFDELTGPKPKPISAAFNATSYAEFKRQRSQRAKDIERKQMGTIFDKLDKHPFDTEVDVSAIRNRELMTPFVKAYILKHIADVAIIAKLMFHYHCGEQWQTVPILKVYDQLIQDLDSIGFELQSGADFETSDSNQNAYHNLEDQKI
jgi:hypothetical protein